MGLKEEELRPLVYSWSAANKHITKFWWDTDAAAKETINQQTPSYLPFGIAFRKKGSLLRLRLPDGRELSYVKPMVINDNITYEGTLQGSGHWGRIESYGPKLVENIVQAVARDCLAETIMKVEAAGYPVVFHVHDELICEVPETKADEALKEILDIMKEPLDWAEGLPLKGDGYHREYYRKD